MSADTRVLLVEDNPTDVVLIGGLLGSPGDGAFALTSRPSLAAAAEHLGAHSVDVILLDLHLPDGSGAASVARLRDVTQDAPIVVLTGANDDELALACIEAGAQDYLQKTDVTSVTLRRAIDYALRRNRLELRALAEQLLTAQEDERRRLSRELHDDTNQRLAALAVELDTLRQGLTPESTALAEPLERLRDRIGELSDDVHALAYRLHPSVLDDLGLRPALESYAAELARREQVTLNLDDDGLQEPLPAAVAACLYRVVQEGCRNAVRHGDVREVTVQLATRDGGVALVVADSGVGFDAEGESSGGLGLVSMRERIRLVDGHFSLWSAPGEGTRIEVWVPTGPPR